MKRGDEHAANGRADYALRSYLKARRNYERADQMEACWYQGHDLGTAMRAIQPRLDTMARNLENAVIHGR